MIQTKPYEFMVKYTQQKDWIDGRGNFIAFAFFLGGISGGLYLASAYFNNLPGMFVAWLLSLLMGISYMIHLSKPLRFWRMLLKPKTSWIARGFIFIMLFIGFTFIQLILSFWFPGTAWVTVFMVLAGIFAFAQSIYTGFAVSYVSAIKIWNSAIVPILFVICGLTGGLAVLLDITIVGGDHAQIVALENIIRVMLIVFAIIIGVYLWNTTYSGTAARDAVARLVGGNISAIFWIGVVLFGIIIPITISVSTYFAEAASALLLTAVVSEIIGGIALRYVILKAGMYSPLVPSE